ncbi:MAG: DNA repair protein RecO [Mycoplasmatales bacterium]|nr:DNA repair protein RecO [Mycoplasmatales bacterium]
MTDFVRGIVIKKVKLNSDDQIITILTKFEIISFIALGTRKLNSKNSRSLDFGNYISAEIFRARLKNKLSKLKKSILIKQPPILTSDTANVILEIIKLIQKIDNHSKRLFEAFLESYEYFGDTYNHWVKTYIIFNSLDSLGVYPQIKQCVECGRNDRINGFDFSLGGYTCAWHTKIEKSIEYLKAINLINESIENYIKIDPELNKKIYQELIYFINDYIYHMQS